MESTAALLNELQKAVVDSAKEGRPVGEDLMQELSEAEAAASTAKESLWDAAAALKKHLERKGHDGRGETGGRGGRGGRGGKGGKGGNICFSGKVGRVSGGIPLNYH